MQGKSRDTYAYVCYGSLCKMSYKAEGEGRKKRVKRQKKETKNITPKMERSLIDISFHHLLWVQNA